MEDENSKIIITVVGSDKVGIVAAVADNLSKNKVNIEDIKQTIIQNSFCMIMLCDIKNMNVSFKEFKDSILELSQALSMEIWIQKKDLFDRMHNIW